MNKLPIDIIPSTTPGPPRFRWKQRVTTILGLDHVQECDGTLPPSIEKAVAELIAIAKNQAHEIEELRQINQSFADRIAAQSEILTAHAEKAKTTAGATPTTAPQNSSSRARKGGG